MFGQKAMSPREAAYHLALIHLWRVLDILKDMEPAEIDTAKGIIRRERDAITALFQAYPVEGKNDAR